ncbi:cysteine desulfurase [Candidatus Kaiserbacteria bacterium]|nr:cysteine desulfurase [Candidatus Kaiserbacteria bacterium]
MFQTKRIYLDYAAATPVRKEVFSAMKPYFTKHFGNAGAIHREGVEVKKVIEDCRTRLSRLFRTRTGNVIFTSGGTESNNLAILGTLEATGKNWKDMEVITTKLEHPSVLKVMEVLEARGVSIKYAPVNEDGQIVLAEFKKLLSPKTTLVTFAYANSETGVIQPVKKITHMIRDYGGNIISHLDASQAPLWLSCRIDSLGVDLMTLDAGKCHGPKGAGVLVYQGDAKLTSQLHGGGQEGGLRAGTENTPLIVGMTTAFEIAQRDYEKRSESVRILRDLLTEEIVAAIPEAVVNGSVEERLANNVNISLPGFDTEYAVIVLDAKGIAASTRSACGAGEGIGSHVVREMTKDDARAHATLRFTLGEETGKKDIKKVVITLKNHIDTMRQGNLPT